MHYDSGAIGRQASVDFLQAQGWRGALLGTSLAAAGQTRQVQALTILLQGAQIIHQQRFARLSGRAVEERLDGTVVNTYGIAIDTALVIDSAARLIASNDIASLSNHASNAKVDATGLGLDHS